MKKLLLLSATALMLLSSDIAYANMPVRFSNGGSASRSQQVSIPTGLYKNGDNFIIVRGDWVRIVVNGNMHESSFRAQMDPYGNYALILENGESITIYSDGRSLYYNGSTYAKS